MTPFTKSLQSRIEALKSSIEAQQTELAAYERVLELESGKGDSAATPVTATPSVPAPIATGDLQLGGSKSDSVLAILKHRREAGVTPGEIAETLAAHKVDVNRNLIYNVVSLLTKKKHLSKRRGRYYFTGKDSGPVAAAPTSTAPTGSSASSSKRRISEEGMARIIAATKKRWAAHRAAKRAEAKKAK